MWWPETTSSDDRQNNHWQHKVSEHRVQPWGDAIEETTNGSKVSCWLTDEAKTQSSPNLYHKETSSKSPVPTTSTTSKWKSSSLLLSPTTPNCSTALTSASKKKNLNHSPWGYISIRFIYSNTCYFLRVKVFKGGRIVTVELYLCPYAYTSDMFMVL